MSGDLKVPGSVLRALSPIPFPALDEHGADVTPLLAEPQGGAALLGVAFTIPEAAVALFHAHLLRCLVHIAGNRNVDDYVRAWLLQRALQVEVERVFLGADRVSRARGLLQVARLFAREGASWSSGPMPVYRHREHVGTSYALVTHAVNAALYATSLAAAAGEDRDEVLQGVVLAAVFADVGIDERTDAARVERAVGVMRGASVGSVAAVVGVLGRRCCWDGTGIPTIAGSVIPFEARCTAIACDYDLLTLRGDHGRPLAPKDALAVMVQAAGMYDPGLLKTFIRLIGGVAGADAASVVRTRPSRQLERVREMLRELRIA